MTGNGSYKQNRVYKQSTRQYREIDNNYQVPSYSSLDSYSYSNEDNYQMDDGFNGSVSNGIGNTPLSALEYM